MAVLSPKLERNFAFSAANSRFLAAFEACGSVAKAARWAKVARTSHFEWLREDPTYRPRFVQAEMQAARGLEDEAVRRAREGVRKPVLYKGKPVFVGGQMLYETEYSDQLLITLLKANNPTRFKDRTELVNLHEIDLSKVSPEMMNAIVDAALKKASGGDPALEQEMLRIAAQQAGVVVETTAEVVETESI